MNEDAIYFFAKNAFDCGNQHLGDPFIDYATDYVQCCVCGTARRHFCT